MKYRNILFVLLSLGLMVPTSLGQVNTSTFLGTITDQSGARVPGAVITITDVGTGSQRKAITGNDGSYVVPNLKPGEYNITTEIKGFKSTTLKGVVLQVDQQARIDIVLEVGEVTQEVLVEGEAPIIATDNATVGEVIDNKKVLELPLNGRQFLQLALLTPGAQKYRGPFGGVDGLYGESGGAFSMNGMDPGANTTILDGVINMEFGGGRQNFSPNIDTIQEFKIQSNVYDASFGLSGAAQVNVVTKRGALDYHGSAFEFHRNDNLDARPFFQPGELPEFRRHQFGGTLGGRIPGSKKDFFFFGYEGKRQARGLTSVISVPTLDIRSGDFSSTGTTIYDPLTLDPATGTRQPFPGNKIPQERITQQAAYVQGFYPAPTRPGITNNFVANPRRTANGNQYSIRYDRDISEKDSFNFRYTRSVDSTLEPQPRTEVLPVRGFGANLNLNGNNINASWTHTFNPSIVNTFSFGFSRFWRRADSEGTVEGFFLSGGSRGDVTGPEYFAGSGITGVDPERQKAGFPLIAISGWQSIGDDTFAPVSEKYHNFVWTDTLSKVGGKHSWKVGVDIIRNAIPVDFEANSRGRISFGPLFTTSAVSAPGNQYNAYAAFLLGQVSGSTLNRNKLQEDLVQSWYMPFFQDDWKIRPDLTLNFGVRWEKSVAMTDKLDRFLAFDLGAQKFMVAGDTVPTLPGTPPGTVTAQSLGYPARNMVLPTDNNDFAPRVGFAWRMFGSNKTALRGGYGVFYSWVTQNVTQSMAFGPPWVPNSAIASNPDVPAALFQNPYNSTLVATSSGVVGRAKENRSPYVQQYSMSLEREITAKLGVSIAYVGNAGRKSYLDYNFNQPLPGPGSVASRSPYPSFGGLSGQPTWGTNHYDSLQVKIRKEVGPEGLLLLGSYTWAKSLGNSISGIKFNGGQPFRNTRNWKADSGPTYLDVRQVLSLSFVYELPFGKGKLLAGSASGAVNNIIGGWKMGGIANLQTGHALTPTDIFNNSNAGGSRPNVIGDPNDQDRPNRDAQLSQWFNTAAFSRAPLYTFGNSGTGIITGPGFQTWDMSLYKDFRIMENKRLQFRAEFFNAFNNVNLGDPNTTFGSALFGRISSSGDARQIQFGLRFDF